MSNMDHMNYLQAVALSDVSILRTKEGTYKGSWKAAGGRSAWFMFRRNMDRLKNMLAPPEPVHGFSIPDLDDAITSMKEEETPHTGVDFSILQYLRDSFLAEDIFLQIEAQPSGSDGTPLACLRDLRRYAILVEAEMIARGSVKPETEEAAVTLKANVPSLLDDPRFDLHAFVATLLGCDRDEAKRRTHKVLYGSELDPSEKIVLKPGESVTFGDGATVTNGLSQGDATVQRVRDDVILHPADPPGLLEVEAAMREPGDTPSCGDGTFDNNQRRLEESRTAPLPPATPEAGSHHSTLTPWGVSLQWRIRNGMAPGSPLASWFDEWFRARGNGIWVLEPGLMYKIPYTEETSAQKSIRQLYSFVPRPGTDEVFLVLDIKQCPPDARDWFPFLQAECNYSEWEGKPDWTQGLYERNDGAGKWVLSEKHQAWAKQ